MDDEDFTTALTNCKLVGRVRLGLPADQLREGERERGREAEREG